MLIFALGRTQRNLCPRTSAQSWGRRHQRGNISRDLFGAFPGPLYDQQEVRIVPKLCVKLPAALLQPQPQAGQDPLPKYPAGQPTMAQDQALRTSEATARTGDEEEEDWGE
eukprot:g36233.t1